jgi:hypothetical protein
VQVTFPIEVTVSGLSGTGLLLQNGGANSLSAPVNGHFTFSTQLASRSS